MDLICRRCGYAWTPKKANPKNCPHCHSWHWQTPRNPRATSGKNGPENSGPVHGGGKPPKVDDNGGSNRAAAIATRRLPGGVTYADLVAGKLQPTWPTSSRDDATTVSAFLPPGAVLIKGDAAQVAASWMRAAQDVLDTDAAWKAAQAALGRRRSDA